MPVSFWKAGFAALPIIVPPNFVYWLWGGTFGGITLILNKLLQQAFGTKLVQQASTVFLHKTIWNKLRWILSVAWLGRLWEKFHWILASNCKQTYGIMGVVIQLNRSFYFFSFSWLFVTSEWTISAGNFTHEWGRGGLPMEHWLIKRYSLVKFLN